MDYTEPAWASSALVVIDVQQDFLDGGAVPIPGTSAVLPRLAELAAGFRAAGRPVVHIVRLYEPGGGDVDLPRRADVEAGARIAAPGTPGSQLAPALLGGQAVELDAATLLAGEPQQLGPREVALFKPRWGAFHRTGLEPLLRGWGVATVVVAGCNLPNCPRATLFQASERDFRTALVTDAVSGATPERLADLAGIGVRLLTGAEVLAALPAPADSTTENRDRDRDLTLAHAVELHGQGRREEARARLLALSEQYPEDPEIAYQTAWAHDVLGLEAEAVPFYELALRVPGLGEEDRHGAFLGLGSTYRVLGRHQESLDTLRGGLAEFPLDPALRSFLAMTLYNLGEHHDAVRTLLRTVAATSGDPRVQQYRRAVEHYAEDLDALG